jgi:predicted membrane protein
LCCIRLLYDSNLDIIFKLLCWTIIWSQLIVVLSSWSMVYAMLVCNCLMSELNYSEWLVGCPCVATAYNNTHINYPPKKFQDFLLIASVLCIIFFFIWLTDIIIYSIQHFLVQHDHWSERLEAQRLTERTEIIKWHNSTIQRPNKRKFMSSSF